MAAVSEDEAGGLGRRRVARGLPVRQRWVVLAGVVAAIAVLAGWCTYARYVDAPDPLPEPRSPVWTIVPSAQRWAAPNGDAAGTRSTGARAALDGRVAWQRELASAVADQPVADERRLYVPLADNRLVALAIEDGREAWTYTAPVPIVAPAVANGRVYVAQRRGHIVALEAASGRVLWETSVPANFFVAPIVADGWLYAFAPEAVYGLDAEDGRLLWRGATGSALAAVPPAVDDGYLAVAAGAEVLVYGRRTGERTFAHPQSPTGGLLVADGRAYVVSTRFAAAFPLDARLPWWEGLRTLWNQAWVWGAAPQPPARAVVWTSRFPPSQDSPVSALAGMLPAALGHGLLAVARAEGAVRAYRQQSGELAWEAQLGAVAGAPVWTADGLLVPTAEGLTLRSPRDGAEVGRLASPASGRQSVVVTTHGTYLVAEDGRVTALR